MLNHCKLGEGLRVRVAFYFQQLASLYCTKLYACSTPVILKQTQISKDHVFKEGGAFHLQEGQYLQLLINLLRRRVCIIYSVHTNLSRTNSSVTLP